MGGTLAYPWTLPHAQVLNTEKLRSQSPLGKSQSQESACPDQQQLLP